MSPDCGFLFSYHYAGATDLCRFIAETGVKERPEVFIDSGGFSAFTQGAKIDLKKYAGWLRRNAAVIDHCAGLDVIGDPHETFRNHLRLEGFGLRPLPVIHLGTDLEWLDRYADRGIQYACLGGLVPSMGEIASDVRNNRVSEKTRWLDAAHERARARGVNLHGFGVMATDIIGRWPWRSTDSSSWNAGLRFGSTRFFDPFTKAWRMVKLRDASGLMAHRKAFRFYGVDTIELIRDGAGFYEMSVRLAARSWAHAVSSMKAAGSVRADYTVFLVDGFFPTIKCAARSIDGWQAPVSQPPLQ